MANDLFGNEITEKQTINRFELEEILFNNFKSIELNDFVNLITNKFIETIEYAGLINGEKTCQKTSLLFNPHRLTTKTKKSKISIFEAFKTKNFQSGFSRLILAAYEKYTKSEAIYQLIQYGVQGVQYVNEFPPHIARDLYLEYKLDANSKILDPCAGWGGRMLGASAVSNSYTCFEPSTQTYKGLNELFQFIKNMNSDFNAEIHCLPFEKSNLKNNEFDFAFTSPPYYDTEEYSNEETNSLIAYNTFEKWCEMFYLPMIEKTMNSLKKDCSFVINIGSRIYPLNEVLINNFSEKYEISKGKDRLSGKGSGLKDNTKEGETFYRIKKY